MRIDPSALSIRSLDALGIDTRTTSNTSDVVALDYRPELPTHQLLARIHQLLSSERRTERLICRYLADMADRIRERRDSELSVYADELHAARCHFGLGARDTRERVRIGRALRQLPRIELAFIEGRMSYSRVREITRVATGHDEVVWLELAQTLDMRSLERRVAGNALAASARSDFAPEGQEACCAEPDPRPAAPGHAQAPSRAPVHTEWTSSHSVRVRFELSAGEWALLERALEGAKRASEAPLSDSAALEAIARDALSAQTENIDASDPRRAVVLHECKRCAQSEIDTGSGLIEIDAANAAALGCGAIEIDLASEGRAVKRGGPLPAATRRAVLLRDQCRCRVPGCNRRRYVDVHHIVTQAEGGEHSRTNCLVLCTTHHRLLHEGQLQVRGDAEGELEFRDGLGRSLAEPSAAKSQGGSCATQDAGARLLAVIGRRGGWTVDQLFEKSGLSVREINQALLPLVLGGRLQQGHWGFDPV